jgi:predicted TIM-barrel fold metal-dependent hydrolase
MPAHMGDSSEGRPDMIIDVHTHIWTSPEQLGCDIAQRLRGRRNGPLDASMAAHDRIMNCVDGSLILGFRSDRLGAHIPNELVAEFARKSPGRRVGIMGIDPLSPDAIEELHRGVDLGLAGVCVSPSCQGFHPAHSTAMRIYELCDKFRLPLMVTVLDPLTAGAVLDFGRPTLWDEVARSFPSLPIVLGQIGHPWVDETLVLISKHARVYGDISGVASRPWQLYSALLSANSLGVIDKLMFGSGFPHETPARAIEALYSVNSYCHGSQLPSVPRTLIKGIVERNALECMGIDAEIAPRHVDESEEAADVGVPGIHTHPVMSDRGRLTPT